MAGTVFRKKSLERIESPDQLDDYIRVTSPGTWMVVLVLVLLVFAGIVWGFFGVVGDGSPIDLLSDEGTSEAVITVLTAEAGGE